MRNLKSLWLGLAVAVAMFGLATTTSASIDLSDATAHGVEYEWWGDIGQLSIVGTPGTKFVAYDINGNAVAGGVLHEPHVSFLAGNAGIGPDGTMIYVIVDDEIVAVSDPHWEWD